jgi:tetratricopeptide (TPR) repeat protein
VVGAAALLSPRAEEELIPNLPRRASDKDEGEGKSDVDRAALLGAARAAVRLGQYDRAISRYEEFFRRFGDDPAVRREYAGVLVTANRLERAAEEFEKLLARRPGDLKMRMTLGDVLVARKQYRQATAHYLQVLRRAPNNVEAAAKLARAYVFDDDVTGALRVYDSSLARLRPGDANVPRALPALLLDLDQPEDALPFLQALRDRSPDDLEILADLVRCYTMLGERDLAAQTLEEMANRSPRAAGVRLGLGDALYQSGDYEVAGLVYGQVLRADPGNGFALVGTARVALKMFLPEQARQVLSGLKPEPEVLRIYRLTWAEYHQLVGEYFEAKQVYADFLCQDPADHEARIALAALDEYVREYEKAKAEYSKVPPDAPLGRKARLGVALTLFSQRLFAQSVEACKALLAENPDDGGAAAQLVRSLAGGDHVDQAVALGRAFLKDHPRHRAASRTVRFALGKVLLDACRYREAACEYEELLTRHPGRVPDTYYGLARAAAHLGDPDRAQRLLAEITSLVGGDARNRLLLADLYAADFEDAPAVEMILAVLKFDPKNLAALIRLTDARQRQSRFSGHIEEAVRVARDVLAQSPGNVRGHLALARSLAVGQQYPASAAAYAKLIALDPTFTVPQRERARVLFSDHQFGASAAAYQQMLTPSADEQLQVALDALAHQEPAVRQPLELLVKACLPGKALQAETARLAAGCGDRRLQAALQGILADYEAHSAEQNGARLEGEAKSKKDIRDYEAVPAYQSLLAAEPGNVEGWFDLGQVFGALRQTGHELPEYGQVLKIDPLHREAAVALERAGLELQPQAGAGLALFRQRGRDGLAHMDTARFPVWVTLPYGDENEFLLLGYERAQYRPGDDRTLDGNILRARLQGKPFDPRLLLFGQVNLETYPDRLHDRPTFEAGAEYDFCDLVHGRLRAFLNNVIENGETLRQDIHRTGLEAGADVRATRTWQFGGVARLAYYSDVNTLEEVYLFNNCILCFPPNLLKVVLDLDAESFAHPTVFPTPDHNDLRGVIHPYFAPGSFAYYEARLEWTHWLSRDYFVHSDQCYYSLQYALGSDSNLVIYNTFRALANFDLKPWLTVGADAQQVLSTAYRATQASAFLVLRLPCRVCPW